MNNIYMGWDVREQEAFRVGALSIHRRTELGIVHPLKRLESPARDRPVEIRNGRLWCPISEAPMSTDFAISRFSVPLIQPYGWAAFVDCDILCRADISKLFDLADDRYAVMVVKHDYKPAELTKMDGQIQTTYPRKNWSSVVLWNCEHPAHEKLRTAINEWPGRDLHAFLWLEDQQIGELPATWNHLVGVNPLPEGRLPNILHYTLGGPWITNWRGGPLDDVWLEEAA